MSSVPSVPVPCPRRSCLSAFPPSRLPTSYFLQSCNPVILQSASEVTIDERQAPHAHDRGHVLADVVARLRAPAIRSHADVEIHFADLVRRIRRHRLLDVGRIRLAVDEVEA